MTTTSRPDPENPGVPNTAAEPETVASQPTVAPPAAEVQAPAEPTVEQLKEIIVALTDNLDQLKGDNLRLLADMDNLRKRTEREKEEIAKYAISKFARDLVSVADNFQRAISSLPNGAAEADAAFAALIEGVGMTERELLNVLERHGVKRINPAGEPFNPHQHQAMMEQQDDTVPPGTILQVFQFGYLLDDRVLRPALVVVAKGGPKPAKPELAESTPAAQPAGPNEQGPSGEQAN